MLPSRVAKATGTYGAPRGVSPDDVGGLPFWREIEVIGGRRVTKVCSAWKPTPEELACLNAGAYLVLGILSEPIPPVSLNVDYLDEADPAQPIETCSRCKGSGTALPSGVAIVIKGRAELEAVPCRSCGGSGG